MNFDEDVAGFYAAGEERDRLTGRPSLEFIRTQLLLERFLPPAPADILDVGGASGVYAGWLADRGYRVRLIDPVPLHVDQAGAHGGFSVGLGDARALAEQDASYDAVLLLGPLYHLVDRADRLLALTEARRVVRPGGVVLAAAISRYASTYDGFFAGLLSDAGFGTMMRADLATGHHRNPDRDPKRFTTAYFHRAHDLAAEVVDAGLHLHKVLAVEGPLHWAPEIRQRLTDPVQRRLILDVLAAMEDDPAITGATAHLLAIARNPT